MAELQLNSAISGRKAAEAQLSYLNLSRRLNARKHLSWTVVAAAAATFLVHHYGSEWDKPLGIVAALLFGVRICLVAKDSITTRREQAARVAAALGSNPQYVAYSSGAPRWFAVPIYIVFIAAALAVMIWQAFGHPLIARSTYGFLTWQMYVWMLPLACFAARGLWLALAWRLRRRYPDRVLVFANDMGIGTADGWVIPYGELQRIDPCCSRSRFGTDNWIEIQRRGWHFAKKVPVNMALDTPDEILKELRGRAISAGADLDPALPNGRPPSGGSQLGYRIGYLPAE
jgi:hypothetical protein